MMQDRPGGFQARLRRAVKNGLLTAGHLTGALAIVRRRRQRQRAVILLYHRVAPPGEGAPDYSTAGMVVTPEEFDAQMRFVSRAYTVVPLSRIVDVARGAAPIAPSLCAITFDDGWRDVHEHALPILIRHHVPATLFVATGPVDGGEWFWEERAKYWFAYLSRVPERALAAGVDGEVRRIHGQLQASAPPALARGVEAIVAEMRGIDEAGRTARLAAVEAAVIAWEPRAARPFMTWDQARELAAAGVEMGNHTAAHVDLRRTPAARVGEEVRRADSRLAAEVPLPPGRPARAFAYPYGSHDGGVRAAVREAGAASACTAKAGYVTPGSDVFQLDRINICSRSAPTGARFAGRILGLC
jgi:peptidoglycan/xylan/chitin deacetylase (PgdA/CDA1 family)